MTQPAFGQILNFKIRLNKIKTKGYWKLHQNTWYYCPIGFRYFLDQLRQFLPHIINGNILYMKTFVNHVLVFHILVSIAIITKCKYVERDKALANDSEKYLRYWNSFCKSTILSFSPKLFYTLAVTKVFLKCFSQKLPLAIV